MKLPFNLKHTYVILIEASGSYITIVPYGIITVSPNKDKENYLVHAQIPLGNFVNFLSGAANFLGSFLLWILRQDILIINDVVFSEDKVHSSEYSAN
ncbi:Hypothetical predicted protein [Prunus dulcis]|uniref:Uncharacterized protein n=1 Tax=Prunus dulcis TaxID=3755 RepID=A0A5E4F2N0_PRUDU|nr:Hypothetical predicted protein [Prunus dulcis]